MKNNKLLNQNNVITWFRRYESRQLVNSADLLVNSKYKFRIEQLDGDGHSKFICYSEKFKIKDKNSWKEIIYMDPIYDFSRTRSEVNEKKMKCLGFHDLIKQNIEEKTIILSSPQSEENVKAYFRELKYSGTTKYLLEICQIKNKQLDKAELLSTAKKLSKKFGFELIPIVDLEDFAQKKVDKLKLKYQTILKKATEIYQKSNDETHDINHALRVAQTLFFISYKEKFQLKAKEDELFLASILHDIDRSNKKDHSESSAKKAIELMTDLKIPKATSLEVAALIKKHSHSKVHEPKLSTAQKLLQDADFLDCFNLEMIPRVFLYQGSNIRSCKSILEHITTKCLYAKRDDFHFESSRIKAFPGWLLLNHFVSGLNKDNQKLEQSFFYF